MSDSLQPHESQHLRPPCPSPTHRVLLKLMSIELVLPSSHLILLSPSPPAPNPSQHQGLFQWVNSSYEVARVLKASASAPLLSGKQMGRQCQTIFGGSKITENGDYGHEITRRLLLRRKVVTNLDSILKSRDITLPTRSIWSSLWFFQWSCMDVRVGL